MRRLSYRWFMSVFLILFIASSFASQNRKTWWGKPIYKELRWMQTTLCFWQNWGMFAPPPGSTSWLLFEGVTPDGRTVEVDPLVKPLEEGFFRWRYDRYLKLSLSSYRSSRKALRNALARNACHRSAMAGEPLSEVSLLRQRTWVVRPSRRLQGRTAQRTKTTTIETKKCP